MTTQQYLFGTIFIISSVLVIIFILIVYKYTFAKRRNTGYVVVTKYEDKDKAAMRLQQLNNFGIELIDQMHKKYKNNPDAMKIIDRLLHKYDPDQLEENDPVFEFKHKAYTFNFRKIAMCLRKINGEFYDYNTLQFVFLHELAHIGSLEKEHTDDFWTIFKYLLVNAANFNDYAPVDYSTAPINYCGIEVSHNPYYSDLNIAGLMRT